MKLWSALVSWIRNTQITVKKAHRRADLLRGVEQPPPPATISYQCWGWTEPLDYNTTAMSLFTTLNHMFLELVCDCSNAILWTAKKWPKTWLDKCMPYWEKVYFWNTLLKTCCIALNIFYWTPKSLVWELHFQIFSWLVSKIKCAQFQKHRYHLCTSKVWP